MANNDSISISKKELSIMESVFRQGLQLVTGLKKKLEPAAPGSSSLTGISRDQRTHIIESRKRRVIKRSA